MGVAGGAGRALRWRFGVTTEALDGVQVLVLDGRLGQASAGRLEAAMTAAIGRSPRVVVDFARVDYISSAALEVLGAAASRCAGANGTLVLAGVAEPVRIALDLAGLLSAVAVEPSRERAIERSRAGLW